MPINPNYIKVDFDEIDTRKRFRTLLDTADTIYLANYFNGYFSHIETASDLMRFQKIEDLKMKKLWDGFDHPFQKECVINGGNFGVNIYFVGQRNDARKKKEDYEKFFDLTSSHITHGGFRNTDFVCTLTSLHDSIQFINEGTNTPSKIPSDEFILGFISLGADVLSNKPLQIYTGQGKLMPQFVNESIVNAKTLVPTQPFGRLFRGGKLISLISQSNELRDFYNKKWGTNVVLWYTMSLYGSTKDSSQYDQLNRHIQFIGNTESIHPMRMKSPHKERILEWLERRGVDLSSITFTGSSTADRQFRSLLSYLEYCLKYRKSDPTIRVLAEKFDREIKNLGEMTEQKRCYVSTFGMENWDDNLINREYEIKEENNLVQLFQYWKKKVFKKKDWGMRKHKDYLNKDVKLEYELLSEQFKDSSFNQIR